MDWDVVESEAARGHLMQVLHTVPRARWADKKPGSNFTLLHYACHGDVAAAAALLAQGVPADARDKHGATPVHWAASCGQPSALELLCAAGAELCSPNGYGFAALDLAIDLDHDECARVLLANGVRLCDRRAPALEAFERGVLRCRAAVVAVLRVKRAGQLVRWDKFLLLEIAVCLWSTRSSGAWQH